MPNPEPVNPQPPNPGDDDDEAYNELAERMFEQAQEVHGRAEWHEHQPKTLKRICIEYYIYGAQRWVSLFENHQYNVFHTMPKFLCDQLLEFLRHEEDGDEMGCDPRKLPFGVWCKLICLLIKKDSNKMDLGAMLGYFEIEDYRRADVMLILSKLAAESPDLEEFSFRIPNFDEGFLPCTLLNALITSFKNLTYLQLQNADRIGNARLKKICLGFPNLVYLKLELAISVTSKGLAYLRKLKNLRLFCYKITRAGEFLFISNLSEMHRVYNWCAQNLPHLEYIGSSRYHPDGDFANFSAYASIFSGTSQLRQLCSAGELPEAHLPNLHTLRFKGPILNVEDFVARVSLYQKLTTLQLVDVDEEHVHLLLKMLGHQLISLQLKSYYRFGDINIIAMCPKLKELTNDGRCQLNPKANPLCAARTLLSLTRLELDFEGSKAPRGLMKMLLASPDIETVTILSMRISKEDCLECSALKRFSLKEICLLDIIPLNCSVRDLEMMVRHLVVNSPSLTKILVDLDYAVSRREPFKNWNINVLKFFNLFPSEL